MAITLLSLTTVQPTTAVPSGAVQVVADTPAAPLFINIPGVTVGQVSMTQQPLGYLFYQAGITPGTYQATLTDSANPAYTLPLTFTINAIPVRGCTDPAADNYDPNATEDDGSCTYTPPPRVASFDVPGPQSLRFILPQRADLPAYDNRPFGDERPLNTFNPGYCQKVERGDTLVLQYRNNYNGSQTATLVPCDGGNSVLTITPTKVVTGAGMSRLFDAYARPDAVSSRLRIYFNDETLPYPFLPGQRVTITNAPGLNGTYPVFNVLEDAAANVPYLLLNRAYPGSAQRIDLRLTTPYALQPFDTYQFVVSFNSVPVGCYKLRITAADSTFATALAESEPIDVALSHPDTVEVVWRNFDNSFNLNYSTGLVNRLRVVARFFDQDTATQKTTLRESTGRLTMLSSDAQRRILLETFLLPKYVHERLAVAFCHDFVKVNDLKGIAEEKYEYPRLQGFALSNGSVYVEQEDYLGAGNRDDVGDVDGNVYLSVNQQFLVVNP